MAGRTFAACCPPRTRPGIPHMWPQTCPLLWPGVGALQAVGALLCARKAGSPSNIGVSYPDLSRGDPSTSQGGVCAQSQSLGTTSSEHSAETIGANPTETAKANVNEVAFPSWVGIEPCPTASDVRITQLQALSIPSKTTTHFSSSLPLGSQRWCG